MMRRPSECPRCQGAMTEGFLVDRTRNGQGVANWVEGAPEPSFWTGIKLRGKKQIAVQTFRCSRCGLLESYAPD